MIKDVQVKGGYIIHMGSVEGTIRVGDKLNLLIDIVSTLMCNRDISFIYLNAIYCPL